MALLGHRLIRLPERLAAAFDCVPLWLTSCHNSVCRAHVGDASGHVSLSNEGLEVRIASWEGGCAADFPGAFQMASTDLALPGFAEVGSRFCLPRRCFQLDGSSAALPGAFQMVVPSRNHFQAHLPQSCFPGVWSPARCPKAHRMVSEAAILLRKVAGQLPRQPASTWALQDSAQPNLQSVSSVSTTPDAAPGLDQGRDA